ncbi:MAG: cytidine deaminase [Bacteroidetes bacterium]|nr:cytidine deaminase [Bacteroidota bacterium]MBV6461781.1 Cytidine deaminase [Flavobacteriales bacterium]WKZ75896.1 MAG: cytidine deaminase [Vicingaceae bacterium]MCL4816726.1 cytidine deaminase [Flavobacteriales bacterium]NOG95572.1 cytidine deaminase [Bacteroidota bacterium]
MNKKTLEIILEEYHSVSELQEIEKSLVLLAKNAAENAYAPYSKFKVGCAVLLDNGSIITGNNQENMAYPSGLCAERVALFSAIALHPDKKIISLAVVSASKELNKNDVFSPCGACRQVMLEYEQKQNSPIIVLMQQADKKIIKFHSASILLPFSFQISTLQKKG